MAPLRKKWRKPSCAAVREIGRSVTVLTAIENMVIARVDLGLLILMNRLCLLLCTSIRITIVRDPVECKTNAVRLDVSLSQTSKDMVTP